MNRKHSTSTQNHSAFTIMYDLINKLILFKNDEEEKVKSQLFNFQLHKRSFRVPDPFLDFSSATSTNCFDPSPTPLFTRGCL